MSCVWMEAELRFMLIQFVSLLVENSVTFLSLLGEESVLLSFVCFMCQSLRVTSCGCVDALCCVVVVVQLLCCV